MNGLAKCKEKICYLIIFILWAKKKMSFLVFYPTWPLSGLKQQQKPKKNKNKKKKTKKKHPSSVGQIGID